MSINAGSSHQSTPSPDSKNERENEEIAYEEESSESEPEFECEEWDNDCKILNLPLIDSKIQSQLLNEDSPSEPELKKPRLMPKIRKNLLDDEFINDFFDSFKNNKSFKNNNVELFDEPFKVCVVENFLDNSCFIDILKEQFNEIDWNVRIMDLYEFFQSKDLRKFMKLTYDFLNEDVKNWVSQMTGLSLSHTAATCSLYTNTDYLLVHDDQREDRMVAFVFYFTGPKGWNKEQGGALQLLDKREDGQPKDVVKEILPANNQLIFFPVTNYSYHQVNEVISLEDCRMSINGWFHTKNPPIFPTLDFKPEPNSLFDSPKIRQKNTDIDMESWIAKEYLSSNTARQIQEYIEENSEISLNGFLKKEPLNEIVEVLNKGDLKWTKLGPPNRFNYEVLKDEDLPQIIERLLSLFQSEKMFNLLHRYTDLDLKAMKFELQRWTPGCYSLLIDYDWKQELDLILYFGCKNKSEIIGAKTQFVTIEDEVQHALVTVEPEENNLNIIFRDTAKFTKYYSKQSQCKCFYTLVCTYIE